MNQTPPSEDSSETTGDSTRTESDSAMFDHTMKMDSDTAAGHLSGSSPPGSDPRQWVGRKLGKYRITGLLGSGGMGVVLKGHDDSIDRDVAIKILPEEIASDEATRQRFEAEAKSAGKLNHPHTITIYEIGQEGSVHYLVMELVTGDSTASHLSDKGAYSVAEATRITSEACKGLAAAHQAELVHRDVKPANLLLTGDGSVKVADFGLAKRTQTETLGVTQDGQLVGTPYYMSPEQCQAEEVDHRSDIYSLAATYFSLLTGECPFQESGSVVQVMYAHCHAEVPDPKSVQGTLPDACTAIIARGMAKDPADRYQSMDEMRTDLEAVLAALSGAGIQLPSGSPATLAKPSFTRQGQRPGSEHSRRSLFWFLGLIIIAAGLVGGWFLFGRADRHPASVTETEEPALPLAPTAKPIRIGILHSLTGTMGRNGASMTDATLLAIEQINTAGGVLGRPIEPIVVDTRSDPERFATEARRLIEDEDVCTVFGCWTSAGRKKVVPIVEEHDHLLIYSVQYEGLEESPNVIYTGAAPNQQIIPAVRWAHNNLGKRKFYLVGSDYVFPRIAHEIIKDQLTELGAELVGETFLPLGTSVVDPAINDIVAAQPDIILNTINGDTNVPFFQALRSRGFTPEQTPTISFSVEEETLRELDPSIMEGDYAAWNYFQTIDTDENREFVAAFHKKYGPQRVVTDPMESAYFAVMLWAKAVEDCQSTDPREIRRAMRNQRMVAPEGEVRIDPQTQHSFKTPRLGQIKSDGQFEIVWQASTPEAPNPYPPSRSVESWRATLHELQNLWNGNWAAPSPISPAQ